MHWLYELTLAVQFSVVTLIFIGFSLVGLYVTRPLVRARWGDASDAVNFFASGTGIINAVLLGMIAVAAWENFNDVGVVVDAEANKLSSLYIHAGTYPEPTRSELRAALRAYTHAVHDVDWPAMRADEGWPARRIDGDSFDAMDRLIAIYQNFQPADDLALTYHSEAYSEFDEMLELRRDRMGAVGVGLPGVLWAVVLLGAVISILLTWLITTEDRSLNVLLSVAYATLVGAMVALVLALDHPLWGDLSIGPEPFAFAAGRMDEIDRIPVRSP